jgi:RimJ/RimL family protein N-acetyltransferase
MRLDEILKEETQIQFGSAFMNPVTKDKTKLFLDSELYIDQEGKEFKSWWSNPEQHFKNGGVFAVAYADGEPVGVGVIKLPDEVLSGEVDGKEIAYIGVVGFLVKEEFRNYGLATRLAYLLENKILSVYNLPDNTTPIVVCTGKACEVAQNFKRIQIEK